MLVSWYPASSAPFQSEISLFYELNLGAIHDHYHISVGLLSFSNAPQQSACLSWKTIQTFHTTTTTVLKRRRDAYKTHTHFLITGCFVWEAIIRLCTILSAIYFLRHQISFSSTHYIGLLGETEIKLHTCVWLSFPRKTKFYGWLNLVLNQTEKNDSLTCIHEPK